MPREVPAMPGFRKPYLAEADENWDGAGSKQAPSRKTCLVIEKDSCSIYSRGKLSVKAEHSHLLSTVQRRRTVSFLKALITSATVCWESSTSAAVTTLSL